jgi:hypothetical protein
MDYYNNVTTDPEDGPGFFLVKTGNGAAVNGAQGVLCPEQG